MHVILFQTSLISISVLGASPYPANELCQRARCQKCGMKGNNTYQIVYTGNSSSRRLRLLDVAMDGAGVKP
mgnify:FL=1